MEYETKYYIKDHRGVTHLLKEGDFIKGYDYNKRDLGQYRIYKMEAPSRGLADEEEILGHLYVLEIADEPTFYTQGHYNLQYTTIVHGKDHIDWFLAEHTLVSQKELVKFGLATHSMDFIIGD